MEQINAVLEAIDRPLNVLVWPSLPPLAELAEAGVSRVSVGSSFAHTLHTGPWWRPRANCAEVGA